MDPINLIGGTVGIAGQLASKYLFPDKMKRSYYKDPYVRKMQQENDRALEANRIISPEASRRASAMEIKSGMNNAEAGALNASTSQSLNMNAGSGDASMGSNITGARAIANTLGAKAPYVQQLAEGHQKATDQELQRTNQHGQLAAQGAEIGDKFIQNTDMQEGLNIMNLVAGGITQGVGGATQLLGVGNYKVGDPVPDGMEVYTDNTGQQKLRKKVIL